MSPSFRPTDVQVGDTLIVRGVRGQDFGENGDCTHWGEHSYSPGDLVRVTKIIPPNTEALRETEYAFVCTAPSPHGYGDNVQTLTADEIIGRFTKDPDTIEAFLNAR